MNEQLFGIVAGALVVGTGIAAHLRSRALIRRWARKNGYEVAAVHDAPFKLGPFFWTTWGAQAVYRVTLRDDWGGVHRCSLRCGSAVGGLLSDDVDVRWDE